MYGEHIRQLSAKMRQVPYFLIVSLAEGRFAAAVQAFEQARILLRAAAVPTVRVLFHILLPPVVEEHFRDGLASPFGSGIHWSQTGGT